MDEFKKSQECKGDCTHCGEECDVNGATVTLTLDDDTVVECAVLTVFPAAGKNYIALLPLDENGENQNGDVYLYRFNENDAEGPSLENIEDDDEYEIAADAFDELLDQTEFDDDEIEIEE